MFRVSFFCFLIYMFSIKQVNTFIDWFTYCCFKDSQVGILHLHSTEGLKDASCVDVIRYMTYMKVKNHLHCHLPSVYKPFFPGSSSEDFGGQEFDSTKVCSSGK